MNLRPLPTETDSATGKPYDEVNVHVFGSEGEVLLSNRKAQLVLSTHQAMQFARGIANELAPLDPWGVPAVTTTAEVETAKALRRGREEAARARGEIDR